MTMGIRLLSMLEKLLVIRLKAVHYHKKKESFTFLDVTVSELRLNNA